METDEVSDTESGASTGKLCTVAVVSLLIGIGLFFLSLALFPYVQPGLRSLGGVFALGIWVATELLVVLVPFLGFIAIVGVSSNWPVNSAHRRGSPDENRMRKVANRFLRASAFFAFLPLLYIALTVIEGASRSRILTDLEGLYLMALSLIALVMGVISFRLLAATSVRFRWL